MLCSLRVFIIFEAIFHTRVSMVLKRLILISGLLGLGCAATAGLNPFAASASCGPEPAPLVPSAKLEPWKTEDIIYTERANQFQISPDSKWLVWVKSTGDKEKDATVANLGLS